MGEPVFKPNPIPRPDNRPELKAMQGGRPAPTEADMAARQTALEVDTEAITERADSAAAETRTVLLHETATLPDVELESVTVRSEPATTTTAGFEAVPNRQEMLTLESDEVATTATKDPAFDAEMDAWASQSMTPDMLRNINLLPEAGKNPEPKAEQAESRLSSAISRGWEGVRNRVNSFFTDAQGKERKGRLGGTLVTFSVIGTLALGAFAGNLTEGFSKNVKKALDDAEAQRAKMVETNNQ